MYEIIIERPRRGGGWGRPWPRLLPWQLLAHDDDGAQDGGPTKVRMGPLRTTKWLNENLAPLRRFLVRHIGQKWDAVHSEISAHITLRSAVQKHVLDHLRHYVELHPVFIGGWPHHPQASGAQRDNYHPLSGYGNSFYVCPDTGTLQLARKPRPRRQKSE